VRLSDRIGYRVDTEGWEFVNPAEAVYKRAITLCTFVCMGGFQYFYEGYAWAPEAADAFDALGMPDLAEAVRMTLGLWPDGRPPADLDERLQIMDDREEYFEDYFGPGDDLMCNFESMERVNDAAFAWLQEHVHEFKDLEPVPPDAGEPAFS